MIVSAAGLAHLHFHGLQDTPVQHFSSGISQEQIMAMHGHKILNVVQKYIANVQRKHLATSATTELEET